MKSTLLAAALALFSLAPAHAGYGYGQGDPRLEKLYTTFIAPCCWRDNLAEHDSPAADQLRSRIQGMVQNGQSDDQIKETLIAEFGPRILALPEGTQRVWLFWTPWLIGAAGLAAIFAWMQRARHRPNLATGLPPAELPEGWDRD